MFDALELCHPCHWPGNICEVKKGCWAEADGCELGIPRSKVSLKTAELRKHRLIHQANAQNYQNFGSCQDSVTQIVSTRLVFSMFQVVAELLCSVCWM
jgi:hypothetical protein